jgi:hypothetical protein
MEIFIKICGTEMDSLSSKMVIVFKANGITIKPKVKENIQPYLAIFMKDNSAIIIKILQAR